MLFRESYAQPLRHEIIYNLTIRLRYGKYHIFSVLQKIGVERIRYNPPWHWDAGFVFGHLFAGRMDFHRVGAHQRGSKFGQSLLFSRFVSLRGNFHFVDSSRHVTWCNSRHFILYPSAMGQIVRSNGKSHTHIAAVDSCKLRMAVINIWNNIFFFVSGLVRSNNAMVINRYTTANHSFDC